MTSDEREIFHFLKTHGSEFVSAVEIARRAGGKKRFYEDQSWAKPLLVSMAERGILEGDINGRYRIKPVRRKRGNRWVSPDIAKILAESGVQVENAAETSGVAEDDHYEQL